MVRVVSGNDGSSDADANVVGGADALVELERAVLHDLHTVAHDRQFMETRLPVEQYNITIPHVSFDDVPYFQVARDGVPVPVVQRLLVPATDRTDHNSIAIG